MTGRILAAFAVPVVLVLLPFVLPSAFYLSIAIHVMVYALLALSLNILIGYGGMTSLGHASFLGVPAYAYAWLTANAGFGVAAAAGSAVLVGTLLAALFAVLSLRATGLGFLMITLALGQVVWGLSYRWVALTGGDNGLNVARPELFGWKRRTPPCSTPCSPSCSCLPCCASGSSPHRRLRHACAARATSRGGCACWVTMSG